MHAEHTGALMIVALSHQPLAGDVQPWVRLKGETNFSLASAAVGFYVTSSQGES